MSRPINGRKVKEVLFSFPNARNKVDREKLVRLGGKPGFAAVIWEPNAVVIAASDLGVSIDKKSAEKLLAEHAAEIRGAMFDAGWSKIFNLIAPGKELPASN